MTLFALVLAGALIAESESASDEERSEPTCPAGAAQASRGGRGGLRT